MRQLFVAFAVLCFGAGNSFAASPERDAFVANVRVNVAFLSLSSQLAADHSDSNDLRDFAAGEVAAERAVVSAIDLRAAPEVALSFPLAIASNDVVTGRSVAVDAPPSLAFSAPIGTGALMPAAVQSLSHLADSSGKTFDDLYRATQINALRQLSALYNSYAMTGDDAALKQLAKTQLDATNERIAALGRF